MAPRKWHLSGTRPTETEETVDTVIVKDTHQGDPIAAVGKERLRTREERALCLYQDRGHEIEQVAANLY